MTVNLQEEGLVDWFNVNEMFYNQNLRELKNKDKNEKMMSEKAKELNISLAELKGWLNKLRSYRLYKTEFQTEPYLYECLSTSVRVCLSRLRLCAHKLT